MFEKLFNNKIHFAGWTDDSWRYIWNNLWLVPNCLFVFLCACIHVFSILSVCSSVVSTYEVLLMHINRMHAFQVFQIGISYSHPSDVMSFRMCCNILPTFPQCRLLIQQRNIYQVVFQHHQRPSDLWFDIHSPSCERIYVNLIPQLLDIHHCQISNCKRILWIVLPSRLCRKLNQSITGRQKCFSLFCGDVISFAQW